jgi:hypothetical protein
MALDLLDIKRDLVVDKVLSLGQCERHYGLIPKHLDRDLYRKTVFVKQTNYSRRAQRHTFVTANGKTRDLQKSMLRHLAGVAELRRILDAPADEWSSSAERQNALLVPDGVWRRGKDHIAVEYDTGSYSDFQLYKKITRYRRKYDAQVWGTPSTKRQQLLSELLQKYDCEGSVFLAYWW